jgi:nitrite reductase (NO-forming)
MFDKVYNMGSLTTKPINDVQTVTVPPGGATVVEFKLEVPGNYMLVDHALTRVERGLVGILEVQGPDNPDIFKDSDPPKSAKSMAH